MKILMAATPASGHLNPVLTIGSMLKRRGDDVIVLTSTSFAAAVHAAGLRFAPLPPAADIDLRNVPELFPERESVPAGPRRLAFDFQHIFIDRMAAQADALRAIIDIEHPGVIVADSLFCGTAPLFLAPRPGDPPIVSCGITFLWLDRPDGLPAGLGLSPTTGDPDSAHHRQVTADFDAAFTGPVQAYANSKLSELGLPRLGMSFTSSRVLLAHAYLQLCGPKFEYDFGPLAGHIHFVGALPPPEGEKTLPAWWSDLDGAKPVVLVTQGTVANYDLTQLLEPTLQALAAQDDILVLATTGGRPIEAISTTIPPNARVERYLPFDRLLPKVSVLVTNGGYGTVSLALGRGIPVIAAGLTEDKAEIAARVAWSGAGMDLRSNAPSPAAIKDAVEDIIGHPSYRANAQAIARELQSFDTEARILAIIDSLAA